MADELHTQLPSPVRNALEAEVDEAQVQRIWQGVQRRRVIRAPGPASRAVWPVLSAAAIVLTVLGGHWLLTPEAVDPEPLWLTNGRLPGRMVAVVEGGESTHSRLSDGSHIVLGAGSRLDTLLNDGRVFELNLAHGEAEMEVRAGGPRRWIVRCGLATVEVVGTRFSIRRGEDQLTVAVARGAVLVRSEHLPDGVRRLEAGEQVTVTRGSRDGVGSAASGLTEAPLVAEPVTDPPAEGSPVAETAAERSGPSTAPASARARWRELARRGAYHQAYETLGRDGLARETLRASPSILLALADVARLSGRPAEAVDPLERLVAEHPGDPQASLAAFTLGKVLLDNLDRSAEAARSFERALDLGLPDSLSQDALARLAQARRRSGDESGARRAALDYLSAHPEGAHAAAMEAVITELETLR